MRCRPVCLMCARTLSRSRSNEEPRATLSRKQRTDSFGERAFPASTAASKVFHTYELRDRRLYKDIRYPSFMGHVSISMLRVPRFHFFFFWRSPTSRFFHLYLSRSNKYTVTVRFEVTASLFTYLGANHV